MSTRNAVRGTPNEDLMNGIGKAVAAGALNGAALNVNGQSMDAAAITAAVQTGNAPEEKVRASRAQLAQDMKSRNEARPSTKKLVVGFIAAITSFTGGDVQKLAAFGIPAPSPRRALTAEQLVARNAKALATREMRGTKGKRQKAAIKATGDFTVSVAASSPPAATSTNGSAPVAAPVSSAVVPAAANGAAH